MFEYKVKTVCGANSFTYSSHNFKNKELVHKVYQKCGDKYKKVELNNNLYNIKKVVKPIKNHPDLICVNITIEKLNSNLCMKKQDVISLLRKIVNE